MNPTRSRLTDTFTAALGLTLGSTLLLGDPTDTVAHWIVRLALSTLAAHLAVSWWRNRYRTQRAATDAEPD